MLRALECPSHHDHDGRRPDRDSDSIRVHLSSESPAAAALLDTSGWQLEAALN